MATARPHSLEVEGGKEALHPDSPQPAHWSVAAQIITSSAIGYMLCYFIRYPPLLLSEIRGQEFGDIFGKRFLVADSMSIAYLLGFGLAKIPAAVVMSSSLYFNNRFLFITSLNFISGLLIALPIALSGGDPYWTTLGVFVGCFPASWVYGGVVSYYEGRTSTDLILAITIPAYLVSGGISRSGTQLLLDWGVAERWTPLLIFAIILVPMTACFWFTDRAPKANAYDAQFRKERTAMTPEKRMQFVKDMWIPLALLMTAYGILTAVKQFRDLFSDELFRASNGGEKAPPIFFTLADALGGLAAFANFMYLNQVKESYRSLNLIMILIVAMLVFSLLTTGLFSMGIITNGLVWQMTVGLGISAAYALTLPIWDRMVAISPLSNCTCTFVVFVADMWGYFVSIAMVLWKRFAAEDESLETVLEQFLFVLVAGSISIVILIGLAGLYFTRRRKREENEQQVAAGSTAMLS